MLAFWDSQASQNNAEIGFQILGNRQLERRESVLVVVAQRSSQKWPTCVTLATAAATRAAFLHLSQIWRVVHGGVILSLTWIQVQQRRSVFMVNVLWLVHRMVLTAWILNMLHVLLLLLLLLNFQFQLLQGSIETSQRAAVRGRDRVVVVVVQSLFSVRKRNLCAWERLQIAQNVMNVPR